jgi:hypothetical protein
LEREPPLPRTKQSKSTPSPSWLGFPIANLARFYRNFGNIHEKLQIAKNFIKKIHISNPKLRIFHLPVEVKNKNYKNQFTQKIFQVVSGEKGWCKMAT